MIPVEYAAASMLHAAPSGGKLLKVMQLQASLRTLKHNNTYSVTKHLMEILFYLKLHNQLKVLSGPQPHCSFQ